MRQTPFFPNSVWNGSSPTREHGDPLIYDSAPTNSDYDRVIAEIIAIEQYLLSANIVDSFSAFSISGISNPLEVGYTILAGDYTFIWTSDITIATDSIAIHDTTNSNSLGSSLANSGSYIATLPSDITYSIPSTNIFTISALDSDNNPFSKTYTLFWLFKVFTGTSASSTLDEAAIKSLVHSSLQSSFTSTYQLTSSHYKFFCFPDSFGGPTLFTDIATGLPISMAEEFDDSFFSNTDNGYSYGVVNITNDFSVSQDYRVYRTQYTLTNPINIRVS